MMPALQDSTWLQLLRLTGRLLAVCPPQAQAAKARGNELYKQRQFDEAIAAYNEAIQLYDKDISFLTNRWEEGGVWKCWVCMY
jgi:tetratricopeptide (TPR) repeat protein